MLRAVVFTDLLLPASLTDAKKIRFLNARYRRYHEEEGGALFGFTQAEKPAPAEPGSADIARAEALVGGRFVRIVAIAPSPGELAERKAEEAARKAPRRALVGSTPIRHGIAAVPGSLTPRRETGTLRSGRGSLEGERDQSRGEGARTPPRGARPENSSFVEAMRCVRVRCARASVPRGRARASPACKRPDEAEVRAGRAESRRDGRRHAGHAAGSRPVAASSRRRLRQRIGLKTVTAESGLKRTPSSLTFSRAEDLLDGEPRSGDATVY